MGVVDEEYLKAYITDQTAVLGRKVSITPDEVLSLIGILKKMGTFLLAKLPAP